jgi:hypothetical protein
MMNPEAPSTPSVDPNPVEKQPWTSPILKKMDIEETAISQGVSDDGDGFS